MTRRDDGFVTVWVLGLCVMVLFMGGVAVDLWRAVATLRDVSSAVDAAAVAGASYLDEPAYRHSGGADIRLDPAAAHAGAAEVLSAQPDAERLVDVDIGSDPTRVVVRAGKEVDLTLLRIFLFGEGPVVVHASATADPRRTP